MVNCWPSATPYTMPSWVGVRTSAANADAVNTSPTKAAGRNPYLIFMLASRLERTLRMHRHPQNSAQGCKRSGDGKRSSPAEALRDPGREGRGHSAPNL